MTPVDVLRSARARIAAPNSWCQGANERAADGSANPDPDHKEAVQWCMDGALKAAFPRGNWDGPTYERASQCLLVSISPTPGHIVDWNDNGERTHADVLHAFDMAIALAEKCPLAETTAAYVRENAAEWLAISAGLCAISTPHGPCLRHWHSDSEVVPADAEDGLCGACRGACDGSEA